MGNHWNLSQRDPSEGGCKGKWLSWRSCPETRSMVSVWRGRLHSYRRLHPWDAMQSAGGREEGDGECVWGGVGYFFVFYMYSTSGQVNTIPMPPTNLSCLSCLLPHLHFLNLSFHLPLSFFNFLRHRISIKRHC